MQPGTDTFIMKCLLPAIEKAIFGLDREVFCCNTILQALLAGKPMSTQGVTCYCTWPVYAPVYASLAEKKEYLTWPEGSGKAF